MDTRIKIHSGNIMRVTIENVRGYVKGIARMHPQQVLATMVCTDRSLRAASDRWDSSAPDCWDNGDVGWEDDS